MIEVEHTDVGFPAIDAGMPEQVLSDAIEVGRARLRHLSGDGLAMLLEVLGITARQGA